MKKYTGPSIRNVVTNTGKLPDNVGFTLTSGPTRKLTPREIEAQRALGCFVILNGKAFDGNL